MAAPSTVQIFVNYFLRDSIEKNVLGPTDRSLSKMIETSQIDDENIYKIVKTLLDKLNAIHTKRFRLLDISPDNIVFINGSSDNIKYIMTKGQYCKDYCKNSDIRYSTYYKKDKEEFINEGKTLQTAWGDAKNAAKRRWESNSSIRTNPSKYRELFETQENAYKAYVETLPTAFTYDTTDDYYALAGTLQDILIASVTINDENISWLSNIIQKLLNLNDGELADLINEIFPKKEVAAAAVGGRRRSKTQRRQKQRRQSRRN